MEKVILVDRKDHKIGLMEKQEAHIKGLLHRAFSVFVFNKNTARFCFGCFKFPVWVRNPKLTADSYIHGKRKLCGQARWETRKYNYVLYAATEKSKDIHRTFVFVFKTCCFSVHVKGICEEFACREPNLNVKLVIAAPAASDLRLCCKLLHYACWLGGHRTVGS